jgi:hypothetical protein
VTALYATRASRAAGEPLMVNLTIYCVSVAALSYALLQTWRFAVRLRMPRVLSVCVVVALLLYLAGVIPATLKVLTPIAAGATLTVLSVLTAWLLHRSAARAVTPTAAEAKSAHDELELAGAVEGGEGVEGVEGVEGDGRADARAHRGWAAGPWDGTAIVLCAAAIIGMGPLIEYVRNLKENVTNPDVILAWDTVTYHLPTLVEMLQKHSLWGLNGAYSSYAFGFELIAGYPAIFFRNHASFVLANAYSLLFLAAAIVLLCQVLVRAINRSGAWRMNVAVTALVAVALWCILYPKQPAEMIGKNDVFIGALTLSILGLLIESGSAESAGDPKRGRALLLLSAFAMGLAAGAKPTGLLFAPFFALLAFAATPRRVTHDAWRSPYAPSLTPGQWFLRALGRMLVFTLVSAAVGGIWYVRNLVEINQFVAAEHARYFEMSLLRNIGSRRLYSFQLTAVVSALAALTPVAMIALALLVRRRATNPGNGALPFVAFTAYLLVALAIYLITPFVVFEQLKWQIRLGMPLFAAAVVAGALVITWVASWRRVHTYPVALVATAVAAGLLVLIPVRWSNKMVPGIAGNNVTRNLSPTGVYEWFDRTFDDRSMKVYCAGLRPYGFVGKQWQNPVFGDPNSHLLFDSDDRDPAARMHFHDLAGGAREQSITGRPRLFAILEQFQPDVIVVGIEPDIDWPLTKPQVDWMKKQSDAFEEIYSDSTASAFRVKDGWHALASQFKPPQDKPLKMGG